jgi:hypothetical protein
MRRSALRSRCQRGNAGFAVACQFSGTQEKSGQERRFGITRSESAARHLENAAKREHFLRDHRAKPPSYFFLACRAPRILFEKSANDSLYSAMVSAILRLCTNCPSLRDSINSAHFKILRWYEIVARVTPRSLARSPQVRLPVAPIASNTRSRVSSPSAFDMFSICFVSITVPSVRAPSLPPISRGR